MRSDWYRHSPPLLRLSSDAAELLHTKAGMSYFLLSRLFKAGSWVKAAHLGLILPDHKTNETTQGNVMVVFDQPR